jgi:hypothetical protein
MKDILMSSDIIGEWKDEYQDHNFNEIVFKDQDNNDGQLFIDVTCKGIRYCFTRFPGDYEPMSAEEYMKWNCEYDGRPNWHKPGQYMSKETIGYTEENIKKLDEAATVMTAEELKDFIDGDYSYLTGEVEREVEHE